MGESSRLRKVTNAETCHKTSLLDWLQA